MIHAPGLLRRRAHRAPDAADKPGARNERGAGAWRRAARAVGRWARARPQAWALLGCCLLIEALAFLTAPGNLISDTKLDLAVDPGRFLSRALVLWDPQQFGQLQDQAVGYLFPMGPFFYLGRLAGLDPWVIQRLWIGTVGVAAFLGTVRLAERLGIGTPRSRIVAGFGYAASPAALTLLGELSSEFLPAAMLPWILIPLVDAARGGRRGRAAARSAFAIALCGGINAAATFAVCLPAVVYLLTLPRPAPRWRILAWWVPAAALATWWWSVPLAVQVRYGVSIVPYTESAAVTTSATSLSNVLRGTENWIGYLVVNGQPWWRLGYWIATAALPTLLTALAAGLGLAGLLRPRLPARRFLLCVLLTGVLIISAGYLSGLGNPLAGPVDHLINGPASAFRNLRKFDPLIRLPVVLGLAHLLASVRLPRLPQLRTAVVAAAAIAIGGLAVPGYASGLAAAGAFPRIPSYWVSAANWLNRHAGHQAVLVEPGSAFGQYVWGSPLDDVLQPLTNADWAERDLSYIGSPGNERLLDAIDQRLAAGDGSPGLAQVLARMGVRYLLVRNDLSRAGLTGAWPARVGEALAASPGLVKVAQFGPPVGTAAPDDAATNFDPPYPPVQIYQVRGAEPVATVQPAAGTLRVYGGPEALLTLADEGLLRNRPVLLNSDGPGLPAAASVVTDTLRRRVRNFGELRTNYSPTLTAGQSLQTFEAAADYTEPGWARYASVARYYGIRTVTASSSAAGIGAIPGQWASGLLPYSAVDGSMRTMWESGSLGGPVGQWIQLGFDSPVGPRVIHVAFTDSPALGPPVTQVTVTSATGRVTDPVQVTGALQPLRVPRGATGWLRITVTGLATAPQPVIGTQVGIKEIVVPGVRASRAIVAPRVPGADPAAVVLTKAQPQPSSCMLTTRRWVCSPALATTTEEQYGFDQEFSAAAAGRATLRGSAVLMSPALVAKYLELAPGQARVSASSRYTRDPQDQPRSAFDGNPATTWIASPTDAHPVLTIAWRRPLTVRTVTIQRPPGALGPLQVQLAGSGGQARGGLVGSSGVLRFAPLRTNKLTFLFTAVQSPLQITNVVIPGVPELSTPAGPFRLHCGLGPVIDLNGKLVPTQVTGTFTDLLTGRPMSFAACSDVPVTPGVNRVAEPARDAFDVQDVVLARTNGPLAGGGAPRVSPAAAPAAVRSWTSARRVLRVSAPTRSYLVVNENFNPGWQARLGGRALRPVRIDGWKQAWLLPAGTAGAVTLTFAPNALYRAAILGGLATLALVALVALWPPAPAWRRIPGFRRAARWFRVPGSRRAPEQAGTRPGEPGGPAAPEHSPGDRGVRQDPDSRRGGLPRRFRVPGSRRAPDQAGIPAREPGGSAAPEHSPGDQGVRQDPDSRRGGLPRRFRKPGSRRAPEQAGTRPREPGGSAAPEHSPGDQGVRQNPASRRAPRPGFAATLTWAAAACGLVLAGLWLGGYPGAAILAGATALFTVAVTYRRRHRVWLELSRPWLVAGLLLAAALSAVAGQRLLTAGASGTLVTLLTNTAPQVICLLVVARLVAALIVADP